MLIDVQGFDLRCNSVKITSYIEALLEFRDVLIVFRTMFLTSNR